MTYVLVRATVGDVRQWKKVFEEITPMRKNAGSVGVRAFSRVDGASEVVILGHYSDKEKAMQMFQSQDFRDASARAGVKAPPEVIFLDELLDLPA